MSGEIRFPNQAEELRRLVNESQLTPDQLAEKAFLKPETFRKYLNGYQPIGKRTLDHIRQAVALELERIARALGKSTESDALHEEAASLVGGWLRLPEDKRKLVKTLVRELDGGAPAPSSPASQKRVDDAARMAAPRALYNVRRQRSDTALSTSQKHGKVKPTPHPSDQHKSPSSRGPKKPSVS